MPTDDEIMREVQRTLSRDKRLRDYVFEVVCRSGVVSLMGSVKSWDEREYAAKVARGVKGVSSVVNEIYVKAR